MITFLSLRNAFVWPVLGQLDWNFSSLTDSAFPCPVPLKGSPALLCLLAFESMVSSPDHHQGTRQTWSRVPWLYMTRCRLWALLWRGFPGCSADKESACNAGDPGSIPGSGRSFGEGIGYPLQYSWASLVAKNLPGMWETWVWFLGWEDPLEEGMATPSSTLAWRIPMDRGAWRATVHRIAESDTTEWAQQSAGQPGG